MADYIGNLSDSELVEFAQNFSALLSAAPTDYAATAAQAADAETKTNTFSTSLDEHVATQTKAVSKTLAKNSNRLALEEIIRFIVNQAKLNNISRDLIGGLGVPTSSGGDAASNATRPIGLCDTSQRLQHTLDFRDEANPDSKRNPRGVLGAEIHRKIGGEPPTSLKECTFLALDTKTPYVIEYDGEHAGMIVHYIILWRFRDGSASPISETITATVAG